MIKEYFEEASINFFDDRRDFNSIQGNNRPIRHYRSFQNITQNLPLSLQRESKVSAIQYNFKGSLGAGNFSEVPWVCVFDNDITSSAQEGYYLVYLFTANMEGVYLSLNQGWTQYERAYGTQAGRVKIRENASKCQALLRTIDRYDTGPINLVSSGNLGKGYMAGNICSTYYPFAKFPEDDKLINDLWNFVGLYKELKSLVGYNILNIENQVGEDEFQKVIQSGKREELPTGGIEKGQRTVTSSATTWSRNKNMSFTALEKAGFKCENDLDHKTFISAATGHQFVEAHHLIPMEYQDDFDFSIDIPENIISLCPTCHRSFHNSVKENRIALVQKFLGNRREHLERRKIDIGETQLWGYYNIDLLS